MNKNILLIVPDERKVYENINIKAGAFHLPSLAFAILGAIAKNNDYNPIILDLTIQDKNTNIVEKFIDEFNPKYIGFTCTSATYFHALEVSKEIKHNFPEIKIFIGGPHVSSKPEETLETGVFDYVFIGESEISFAEFLQEVDIEKIEGIAFKNSGIIHKQLNTSFLKNLDEYPIPDYTLYDLSKYNISSIQSKNNPVVWLETSRGCPFDCQICNKIVHGQTFRPKSSERVIEEIKHFLNLGIKEFHIADDGFTSDMKRASDICDKIISNNLNFSWACVNGIRVDRVNYELLKKMKEAGCYRISFGIESGNQDVLNNLGKRITIKQIKNAVKIAKKAGLEVFGFFMFGFEDETEATMKDTIKLAQTLPLDLAKASIVIPFPGSPLYEKYKKINLIYPEGDYRRFNVYESASAVYKHPCLDWDIVELYQEKFYRKFYFNPAYLFRRLVYSIKNNTFLSDIKIALATDWFKQKEKKMISLENEETFHDDWADTIEIDSVLVDEFFEAATSPENKYIMKKLGDIKDKKVMELGCGAGEASVYFAKKGADVVATDISEKMLEVLDKVAQKHKVSVTTKKSLSDKIDFEDESFDIVYAANLLHHVDIESTLAEVKRVLKTKGIFVCWDPLAHNPIINIYRQKASSVRTEDEHPIKMSELKLFKKYFSNVKVKTTWFFTLYFFLKFYLIDKIDPNKERYWKKIIKDHKKLEKTYNMLETIDNIFLKCFPFMKRFCWNIIIIGEKD